MRKITFVFLAIIAASCASGPKNSGKKPLYEILTEQTNGGGNIHFFEILTEPKEIAMLQGDENIQKKITAEDMSNSNFIILNMGEKTSGGYSITVEKVEETANQIIVTVKEQGPSPGDMAASVMTYPYCIVKINSKKEIIIK